MSFLHALAPVEAGLWEDVPAPKVLAGTPRTRSIVLYQDVAQKLYAGAWEATPGKWRIAYTEWEYVEVISGACVLEGDDGTRLEAGPGQKFVIEPGFTGTWEVLAPMRKTWVIKE